jgi:hypothetical protein
VNNGSKLVTDVIGNDGEGSRRCLIRAKTMTCLQPLCQATEISKYNSSGPDLKTELLVREVGVLPAASIHEGMQTMK